MARGRMEYNGWYKVKKGVRCLRRNVVDMRRSGAWASLLFQLQGVFFKRLEKEGSRAKSEYHRSLYVYVEFHNKTKGFQWHRAQLLLDRLRENSLQDQYFRGVIFLE